MDIIHINKKILPTWILVESGLFALMAILVGIGLCISPDAIVGTVDVEAKGVERVLYLWGARQFALGSVLAFATFKRSIPMLTISYIFLLVMFIGDFLIGILQEESTMIIAALVMCIISLAMIYVINKRK